MPGILTKRLEHCADLQALLDCVLSRSLELTDTGLGNIQLMDWKAGHLAIQAQRGFDAEFLRFFCRVKAQDGSACGRALRRCGSVIIADVMTDADFEPCRAIAAHAGFRAVQSTPLISSSGAFLGVLSTHFATLHSPSRSEMDAVKGVALLAANAIIAQRAQARLWERTNELARRLEHSRSVIEASETRITRSRESLRSTRELLGRGFSD